MEQAEEKKELTLVQKLRKIYAQLKVFKSKMVNEDFRQFRTLEYGKVEPEEVTDIQRLKYLRNLNLAEKGYINTDVAKLIDYYQKREELIKLDIEILPVGHIKFKEEGIFKSMIHLGFSEKLNGFKVAYNGHDNILIWKPLDESKLTRIISQLHPKKGNTIQFEHSFFHNDIKKTFPKNWESVAKKYNEIIHKSFKSNKYFENGIIKLNLDILKNLSENEGQTFLFPLPYRGHQIFKLTEANDQYLVFQSFLETTPTPNTFYFSHDDIKKICLDAKIQTMAKLKHNLLLGVENGQLFIGTKHDKANQSIVWNTFKDTLVNPEFSSIIKHYLAKEVISKKNFLIEDGAIELKHEKLIGHLKKHFKTNQWHYADCMEGEKNLNFKPIGNNIENYIKRAFPSNTNLDRIMGMINKDAIKNSEKKINEIKI